jgi:hypothetical protein
MLTFTAADVVAAHAGTLLLSSCAGAPGFADFAFPDGNTWTFDATARVTAFEQSNACNTGRSFKIVASRVARNGQYGEWLTTAPTQIALTGAFTPANTLLVNPSAYLLGYFFNTVYQGGSRPITLDGSCCGGMDYGSEINQLLSGHWFGIRVSCGDSAGCTTPSNTDLLNVSAIEISATDTTPPTIAATGATNLFDATTGWVRGVWPMPFQASADDGVCHVSATVDGATIAGPSVTPDDHMWMQCRDPLTWADSVDTTAEPNGPLTIGLHASDAATPANTSQVTRTVHVDNTPVTLALSGPSDWLSTNGAATIKATATAGPSGLAGIWCSVDGSPFQRSAAATASLPIAGLGLHHISCQAASNAMDASGTPARSAMQTRSLTIRQPSVTTVSFTAIADALQCHRVKERVRIPARWVTVRTHGQKVRIKLPAQTRTVKVTRCKPRIEHRRVRVAGHWYTESVVVLPHKVKRDAIRASFGSPATINGWLGTTGGTALAGRTLRILARPDLPDASFSAVASAVTRKNGAWTAALPPGPSRTVEVAYGGTDTVEPATSPIARVTVPAAVRVALSTHATHWGDTIEISGNLRGCCVPPDGELVSLRIGWHGGSAEIGQVYARAGGRFRTPYTFLRGTGTQTYRIWATTARESDYPYAPGTSARQLITVRSP